MVPCVETSRIGGGLRSTVAGGADAGVVGGAKVGVVAGASAGVFAGVEAGVVAGTTVAGAEAFPCEPEVTGANPPGGKGGIEFCGELDADASATCTNALATHAEKTARCCDRTRV